MLELSGRVSSGSPKPIDLRSNRSAVERGSSTCAISTNL